MFDRSFITNAISRSAETGPDRRRFLRAASLAGIGVAGAGYLATRNEASAQVADDPSNEQGPSDPAILNFALNLEYLEAEFYLYAVTGAGLPDNLTTGKGTRGGVTGGSAVSFDTPAVRQYAK